MNKKITLLVVALFFVATTSVFVFYNNKPTSAKIEKLESKKVKKSIQEKMLYAKERELHELAFQINPITGKIPLDEKEREFSEAFIQLTSQKKSANTFSYVLRGPSNLGGRTRAVVVDRNSASRGKIIIAGGVSSGVFRTTDGGQNWTKVSSNNEIHNCTTIAQDPRPGFENIWYYGTGEWSGNSASLGSAYRGQGVWTSTDNGVTWSQISLTNSVFTSFDSPFDYINHIEVSPTNGHVFIATTGKIYRYDGVRITAELQLPSNGTGWTDVKIASNGRVFASLEGSTPNSGVYTSLTGLGGWTKISDPAPTDWNPQGRIVLGTAPSNNNIVYVLYNNGKSGVIEADLWKYEVNTTTWTNLSSKLPDEPGGDLSGNDPFAIQGGYDLVVAVKPDNENHLFIGGTNAYEIKNIQADPMFSRIGGYKDNTTYALYDNNGVDHHPDIHCFAFDPNNSNTMYSGTDGGVHRFDVTSVLKDWTNMNNNYQTYQYYHVALDPTNGSDMIIGGAQDNGTTAGGLGFGNANKTEMFSLAGGDGVAVALGKDNGNNGVPVIYLGTQNGPIFRRITNYVSIRPTGSTSQFVTYFYLDPDNNNALYYAGNIKLYKTKTAETVTTTTWDDLGAIPTVQNIRSLATTRGAYDPNNSYLFIGDQGGNIIRIKDPQNITNMSTAEIISPVDATKNTGTIVSGIATHPTNKDIVLATYSNYGILNIFLTTNATAATPTWTVVERNLDAHSIRSAAITEVNGQTTYFVGTARGLYSSSNPTAVDWQLEGSNTIGLAVVSSLVYRPSDHKLLIGTHGNGMFETDLSAPLSTTNFATNTLELQAYPNPTTNFINVKSKYLDAASSYKIFDIKGSLVDKGKLANTKLNVSNLKGGTYFLQVFAKDKKQTIKFIKN